ncbi:MAG: sigma 54-interacting transcriptional regulator [Planctomycetes bacterium]|nr:sigma 54-interacting transcriptional regulator [Planctomycetota bacterium]
MSAEQRTGPVPLTPPHIRTERGENKSSNELQVKLAKQLEILQEITLALNSTLEPGPLLDRILDASIRYTGATTGSVILIDNDQNLRIVAARGLGSNVEKEVILKVGQGVTGWVALYGKPLNVPDVRQDSRYVMVKEHIRSELAVPMVLGKKAIGVISVDSSKEGNFSEDDLQILTFVGSQAAQILQNAKAYNEIRRKNDQDETLVEISQALGSALDFKELFQEVGEILNRRCAMRRSFLVLLNPETEELSIELAFGMTPEEMARGKYRIGEGITGWVVKNGKPFGVQDIRTEPKFLGRTGIYQNPSEQISFLAMPIFLEGKPVGALGALKPFPGEEQFEADMGLLQIIASTISQAVKIHFKVMSEKESLLLENRLLKEELKTLYHFDNLVGSSEAMEKVYAVIRSVSRSRSTVLIRGESGTGKELIAHAIHFNSPRADRPFVKVNCAAIPENLLEAELFGHVKGSFTGAVADRKGKFIQADGGTVFLDEIGDMSPVLQVKILRVLQEREVEPVGSDKTFKVDVRILAATHRNLEEMVASGSFREDLYYRLNVVPIHVPPLRERLDDIPALAEHVLERFRRENALPELRIAPEAARLLMRYQWPGNVRELENVLERAAILCDGKWIRPEDLPIPLGQGSGQERLQPPASAAKTDPGLAVEQLVKNAFERQDLEGRIWEAIIGRIERDLIHKALERADGVRHKAAEILGIHRNTLRKKLEGESG